MASMKMFLTSIAARLPLSILIFLLCAGSVRCQTKSAAYTFEIASGFLCDTSGSGSCTAVARSAKGDSYEISGAGTFDAQNKSITAAGTFSNKSGNGNVLGTGVWIASELVSFDSYGIAPTALLQNGRLGPPQPGPRRSPIFSGSMPTGGLAVFRILLIPMSGATQTAVLQANCALGHVPQDRSAEGIRLALEKSGNDYSEELSGHVMFLLMRPGVMPAKTLEQDPARESSGMGDN